MISNNNYVAIQGWMINELGLSGNELMAYALIYGFSQDGKSDYHGGLQMIQDWLNCGSRTTAVNIMKSLVKKGHIEKATIYKPGTKCIAGCRYFATICHQISPSAENNGFFSFDFDLYRDTVAKIQAESDSDSLNIDEDCYTDIPDFIPDVQDKNIGGTNSVPDDSTKTVPPIQDNGVPNSVTGVPNSVTGVPNSVPEVVQNLAYPVPNSVPNNHDNHKNNIQNNINTNIYSDRAKNKTTRQNPCFSKATDSKTAKARNAASESGGPSEEYARMIFDACGESHVPNCDGNFLSFSQRDLRLAMSGIHELNLSDEEVLEAIRNYGAVLDLMSEGKTWWSRVLRIDQLFSGQKKSVMNFLPGNFRIDDFLVLKSKNKSEMTLAEKREASYGWDKII